MTQQLAQWACLVMLVWWMCCSFWLCIEGMWFRQFGFAASHVCMIVGLTFFALLLRAAGTFSMIW